MKYLKTLVEKHSTGKKVIILFVLTNIVYAFMLIVTIPKTMEFAGGMKLLDMMPTGYNWEYVNELFYALGPDGRHFYLFNQIPIDMIYPLLFAIIYPLLFVYFLKKLNNQYSAYFYLSIFPLIAGITDYLENIGTILMLNSYPDISRIMVNINSVFATTKALTTSLYFMGLVLILFIWLFKTLRKT